MGHKRVVHVIDDEADVCEALKVLLHTAGMEARTYASAEEFLAEVRLSRPLCLLVDVRLPGMSGLGSRAPACNRGRCARSWS